MADLPDPVALADAVLEQHTPDSYGHCEVCDVGEPCYCVQLARSVKEAAGNKANWGPLALGLQRDLEEATSQLSLATERAEAAEEAGELLKDAAQLQYARLATAEADVKRKDAALLRGQAELENLLAPTPKGLGDLRSEYLSKLYGSARGGIDEIRAALAAMPAETETEREDQDADKN